MSKKIKINTERKIEPRLSIPYNGQMLVVNDPSEKFKSDLMTEIIETIVEDKELDEKKILLKLIDHCTNVEFDKDILEVEYLTHEAKLITNEVLVIFQEIVGETYQLMQLALEQTRNEALQEGILNEKNKIEIEVEKNQKNKEKIKKIKEEEIVEEVKETRVVKKPQRRRKR